MSNSSGSLAAALLLGLLASALGPTTPTVGWSQEAPPDDTTDSFDPGDIQIDPDGMEDPFEGQFDLQFEDIGEPDFDFEPKPPSGAELIIVMVTYGIMFVVVIGVLILIIYLMSNALAAVPQPYRLMEPGMVWLMLIPCFNLIWIFFVVIRLSGSYKNFFQDHGKTDVGDCGSALGIGCAVTNLIGCVPVALVLLILYLVKIYGLKRMLEQMGSGPAKPGASV